MITLNKDHKSPTGQGKQNTPGSVFYMKGLLLLFVLLSMAAGAQQFVPYNGSSTITCGTNTQLQDHNGNSNYWSYAYGYTVLDVGPNAAVTINGTYDTEAGYDYINIYDGAGTNGTLLGSYDGFGTINIVGATGQIITVEFYSDGYIEYPGFDFTISYSGSCFSFPCSGAPTANTVIAITSTLVCPGSNVTLDFTNQISLGNITAQWQESTQAAVGPFVNMGPPVQLVGPGSSNLVVPNVTAQHWYRAVLMCQSGGTTNLTPVEIDVKPVTISTIPYFEDFEGISANNELPNCSWAITDPSRAQTATQSYGNPRVPYSGTNYAYFNGNPATGSTHYFYTNGIQLNSGVTYSASVMYNVPGYPTWANFALMVGPNQAQSGMVTLANVPSPMSSGYTVLSNTFTVPSPGVYYVAIRAKGTNSYDYLAFDDLSITAPCTLPQNNTNLTLSAPPVVCAGTEIMVQANGADTYTWSNGSNASSVVETPTATTIYKVVGTRNGSNCTDSLTVPVTVNQLPIVSVFFTGVLTNTICEGQPITLQATGALSYTWSQGSAINGAMNTVTPSANSTYSVVGSDVFGCVGTGVQNVFVNPLPNISVSSSHSGLMCVGEDAVLTGYGASSFMWSGNIVVYGNPVTVSPKQSVAFVVTGTDDNGCAGKTTYVVGVADCVGLEKVSTGSDEIRLYPNPAKAEFNVELHNGLVKTIEITDVSGRLVLSQQSSLQNTVVKTKDLAAGVYYVKVKTSETSNTIKLIKE